MNAFDIIDIIVKFLTSILFTALVNITQIASLVITIIVYFGVKRIKKYYTFVGRHPDLVKNLRRHASKIVEYLSDFDGFFDQIQTELKLTEVTLATLEKKIDDQPKKSIRRLRKTLRKTKNTDDLERQGEKGVRSIYNDLLKIDAEITELRKDQQWEMSP